MDKMSLISLFNKWNMLIVVELLCGKRNKTSKKIVLLEKNNQL